jgi:hypothetical protein
MPANSAVLTRSSEMRSCRAYSAAGARRSAGRFPRHNLEKAIPGFSVAIRHAAKQVGRLPGFELHLPKYSVGSGVAFQEEFAGRLQAVNVRCGDAAVTC